MNTINNSTLQNPVKPAQSGVSGGKGPPPSPDKAPRLGIAHNQPEDIVTLSANSTLPPDFPANKKPSIPVTSGERKALRDGFSVYA